MMRRWEWRERRGAMDDLVIRRGGCRMGSGPWGWRVFLDSVRQVRRALPVLRILGLSFRRLASASSTPPLCSTPSSTPDYPARSPQDSEQLAGTRELTDLCYQHCASTTT